jgi:hypothetical protein
VLELSEEELDALVERATVDAYNDEEQLAGFAVMIEDNLEMPFEITVLGVMVTVKGGAEVQRGHRLIQPALLSLSGRRRTATSVRRQQLQTVLYCSMRPTSRRISFQTHVLSGFCHGSH